jgi:hypothetical protein
MLLVLVHSLARMPLSLTGPSLVQRMLITKPWNACALLMIFLCPQRELNAVDFKVSADMKFVLLISDVRPGWRHARLARYHVYDVINR